MASLVRLVVGSLLLAAASAFGQDRPRPVSLIQLLSTPEKFDGKIVTVTGFLAMSPHPEFFGQQPILYVHQVDAENVLVANSVLVVASEQMRRDREKLDGMYVTLTGLFRAIRADSQDSYASGTIANVRACTPWSDPKHPVGVRQNRKEFK